MIDRKNFLILCAVLQAVVVSSAFPKDPVPTATPDFPVEIEEPGTVPAAPPTPLTAAKTAKTVKAAAKAVGAAASTSRTLDRIGVVVNGDSATLGEIEEEVLRYYMSEGKRPPSTANDKDYLEIRGRIIDNMVEELVISQQAAAMTIEVSMKEARKQAEAEVEGIKKRFDSPKEFTKSLAEEGLNEEQLIEDLAVRLKRQMQVARVMKRKQEEMPSSLVTGEDQVKKAYEGHERDYDQVKFSYILFHIPAGQKNRAEYKAALLRQAEEMVKELKAGADFAAYARKYSEDPSTADKGGEAGTRYRYELPGDLASGLFALPFKKGIGLVTGKESVYVVKVAQRETSTYESAAPMIRDRLVRESTSVALQKWVQEIREKAYVKVME